MMAELSSSLDARIDALERDVADIKRILLTGNGHPPMTERVAGLERALATQTWLLRTILVATLGNIAGQIISHFMGG